MATEFRPCRPNGPARGQAEFINWKETPAMGHMHYLAAAKSGGGNYTFLIVIVVLFGLLYFVMIRPQRNKQRRAQAMQNTVQPGQRVRTTAGMYATVVESDDRDVVLEVAPGVHMRFLRRAVMETLPDDDGTAGPDLGTEAAGSSFDEPDGPEATPAEGTVDSPATEHLNGSSPGSTGPGSTAADHTAQDERTAD
ncbi:MAG: preprotein translocase subunit YajC [Streptosporangiaceae bacterium]